MAADQRCFLGQVIRVIEFLVDCPFCNADDFGVRYVRAISRKVDVEILAGDAGEYRAGSEKA